MGDNETNRQTNKCNTLAKVNENWTKISTYNASRQVTSMHRWKLVKCDMLVQNGLFKYQFEFYIRRQIFDKLRNFRT